MDKVCILGTDGFTGQHLQEYIRENSLSKAFSFFGYSRTPISNGVFPVETLEATNRKALEAALTKLKPQYIINLIGSPQVTSLEQAIALNTFVSRWVCEIVLEKKISLKNFLAIGSAAEYGNVSAQPIAETHELNPETYYGLAKSWQTEILMFFQKKAKIPTCIARTFNIVGKGLPPFLSIGSFAEQIRDAGDGDTIHVGNIDARRDFLAIDDVVDAYWKILTQAPAGNVYNVCSGKSHTVSELLNYLIIASGKRIVIKHDPQLLRSQDQREVVGNNSKLCSAVDWQPSVDILTALAKMVQ